MVRGGSADDTAVSFYTNLYIIARRRTPWLAEKDGSDERKKSNGLKSPFRHDHRDHEDDDGDDEDDPGEVENDSRAIRSSSHDFPLLSPIGEVKRIATACYPKQERLYCSNGGILKGHPGTHRQICFRGDRLRDVRRKAKMTQQELADKVGVSRTQVTNWELGNSEPSVTALVLIAYTMNVSTDFLLDMTNAEAKVSDQPECVPLPFDD